MQNNAENANEVEYLSICSVGSRKYLLAFLSSLKADLDEDSSVRQRLGLRAVALWTYHQHGDNIASSGL